MSMNFLNEANEVTFTLWQSAVSREKRGKKLCLHGASRNSLRVTLSIFVCLILTAQATM